MKYFMFLIFVLLYFDADGQTCLHTDLSKKFDYQVTCTGFHLNGIENVDSSKITVVVIDKKTKKTIQTIAFTAGLLFDSAYKDRNAVRSYITLKNRSKESPDYDFGDFIIADLNFDGREDIAVKYDSGGNGGPQYNYYLQNDKGQFKKDNYLSKNVWPFPGDIDRENKTLTILTHAGVTQQRSATFKYNVIKKRWYLLKSRLIDY